MWMEIILGPEGSHGCRIQLAWGLECTLLCIIRLTHPEDSICLCFAALTDLFLSHEHAVYHHAQESCKVAVGEYADIDLGDIDHR